MKKRRKNAMEKLKMQTANKADENFKKLAEMFPNAVTEAKNENGEIVRAIDKDVLMQEINTKVVDGKEERYQFTWPDKKKSVLLANAPINKTLRPCREESVDFDNTENLYIEGDNLEVLKLLQETYLGKIKMIYIDPPYNTGHDFVYEDDFAMNVNDFLLINGEYDEVGNRLFANSESSGRFHTDWLNMIYPRLKIAKDLLTSDGAIFISIDDNELENLTKICNEIFGESNFVGCICRATGTTTGQDANKIGSSCDYCLVYSKSNEFILNGLDMDEKDLKRFNEVDEKGRYSTLQLRKTGNADTKEERPNMFFQVTAPDGSKVYPFGPTGYLSRWRVSRDSYAKLVEDNMIVWKKSDSFEPVTTEGYEKSPWTPYVKYYLEGRTKQVSNLFQDIEGNKKASIVLKDLLGSKGIFDNPKPVEFLRILIQISTNSDDYILDFFSGSGTTAHAAIDYSAKTNEKRKFIMVQLPEETDEKSEAYKAGYKNICEIGKERIRRAGQKIRNEQLGIKNEGDNSSLQTPNSSLDTGFRVLKCDTSNMKDVYYNPAEYEPSLFSSLEDNIKEDRTPEDLLFQVMLDLGILLSSKIQVRSEKVGMRNYSYFDVEDGYLIACFDKNIDEEVITAIAKQKPYYFVMRDSSMATDSVATNFEQIFAAYSPDTVRKVL
jgi:adenine-specific DNA-methyltransferase